MLPRLSLMMSERADVFLELVVGLSFFFKLILIPRCAARGRDNIFMSLLLEIAFKALGLTVNFCNLAT